MGGRTLQLVVLAAVVLALMPLGAGAQMEPPEPGSDFANPLRVSDEWRPRFKPFQRDWEIARGALKVDLEQSRELFAELHERARQKSAPAVAGQLDLLGRFLLIAGAVERDGQLPTGVFAAPLAPGLDEADFKLTVVAERTANGEVQWQARNIEAPDIAHYLRGHGELVAERLEAARQDGVQYSELVELLEMITAVPGYPRLLVSPAEDEPEKNPYWGWTTRVFNPLRGPALLAAALTADAWVDNHQDELSEEQRKKLKDFAERARARAGSDSI